MTNNFQQTLSLLERTPTALNALLRELPDSWTHRNEGANTWTVFDVIAHLVHTDRVDWMPRARMILQFGESKAFEPLDRNGHSEESRGKTLGDLLDEFARLRTENLQELRDLNLQSNDFERRGLHPSFGSVTLAQLLDTWAAHDLTHLHQISRIMAYQYRDAVGPWTKFLGVMHCDAHSAPA